MEAYLEFRGLFHHVEEDISITEGDEEDATFDRERKQVCAAIILNLEYDFLKLVRPCRKDPFEMWKKIKEVHKSQASSNVHILGSKLLDLCMGSAESIQELVSRITDTESEMSLSGVRLPSADKKFALLRALRSREEFSTIRTILEMSSSDKTFNEMVSLLQEEEERLGNNNGKNPENGES